MNDHCCLLAVVRREYGEAYDEFLHKNGVDDACVVLCEGTARRKTLDLLGLESKTLALLTCVVSKEQAEKLLRGLVREMRIEAPNTGIAWTIPLDQGPWTDAPAAGAVANNNMDEVNDMNATPYTLIVSIAEKGCSDMVMDAARSAGATGGTVIHAKGTGAGFAPKFFGVSLADEKEIIYIVARRKSSQAIMEAIVAQAGATSPAHASAFSLPVSGVVGLFSADDD